MKSKINFLSLVFLSSLLALGSGGGGSGEESVVQPVEEKAQGMSELGPIKGATISIQALDGYTLYTTDTNDSVFFDVKVEELKSAIYDRYNPGEIKFLKVVSVGGIDTDPNDDGIIVESEQKEVLIPVKGIVPVDVFLSAEKFRINFISTALYQILEDQTDVSDEQISYIAKRLGVSDINLDGVIDIKDLIQYSISDHESPIESDLVAGGYLDSFHNGDVESQKLFVDNIKYSVGFIRPLVTKDNGFYRVKLSKINASNTIYYGVSENSSRPGYELYACQELIMSPDSVLFFEECSPIEGCYKLQKLIFHADNYYEDYERINFDRDQLAEFEETLTLLSEARISLDTSDTSIHEIEDQISNLDGEITRYEQILAF